MNKCNERLPLQDTVLSATDWMANSIDTFAAVLELGMCSVAEMANKS